MKPVTTILETIDPAKAAEYLEKNLDDNRQVRQTWVKQIADSITRGEWRVTHQGIAFDDNGKLVDGQHRLMAICQAGKSAKMLVTRNVDPKVYRFLDCGQKRSPADRLRLCNDVATNKQATSLVLAYIRATKPGATYGSTPPISLIETVFLEKADAFDLIAKAFRNKLSGLTRADVGAAIAIYTHVHPEDGQEFLTKFMLGEELSAGDPILKLRAYLLARHAGVERYVAYWKTIWATRAYHEGRKVHSILADTQDWAGNHFSSLTKERSKRGEQAGATRKLRA